MASVIGGRSIAIWADRKSKVIPAVETEAGAKLEVHFNYWHVKSQKTTKATLTDFFDIGVMVHACGEISSLKIYLPVILDPKCIKDLGRLFSSADTASGIFNESLTSTTGPKSNYITLQSGNKPFARVYIFEESELVILSNGNGTTVEIPESAINNCSSKIPDGTPLYFRLRFLIPKENGGPFSRVIRPTDSWLLSSFDYTEFLDFRLNEARNLPVTINQKLNQAKPIPICRIDYLVVVGEAADVYGGVEANKKRLLENELWQEYTKSASSSPLSDGMIIHHWKKISNEKGKDIGDFSAFIKLKIRRSGRSLVWRYLLVVALIGCLGSILASVVWTRFELENKIKPAAHATLRNSAGCEKI